jgi:hypothetical protein
MKNFYCNQCGKRLYFENTHCLSCGAMTGFVAEDMAMCAFVPVGNGGFVQAGDPDGRVWKPCRNYTYENVCNWMVAAHDSNEYCLSCRLNEIIPDLSAGKNRILWAKIEAAKRRLVFSLLSLNLPLLSKQENSTRGLAFRFLADPNDDFCGTRRVLTGHERGTITINIAEADDAVREKMRLDLREVYRTLLGHFRHESGHFYWDRLFMDHGREEAFRAVFGDERANYREALARYHQNGPVRNWTERFISAYATAHPWEDWAESWAHYLHITDTLETAWENGVEISVGGGRHRMGHPHTASFTCTGEDWHELRLLLNSLNRSMGMSDPYPFVMNAEISHKLAFIHDLVLAVRG